MKDKLKINDTINTWQSPIIYHRHIFISVVNLLIYIHPKIVIKSKIVLGVIYK